MKCKKIFIIMLILIFLVIFLISIYILLKNLQELSFKEAKETEGGILGVVAWAFWLGVGYGYVKEKLESGQW